MKKCDVPITTNEPETNLRVRLLFETGFKSKLRDESMWARQQVRGAWYGGCIFVEFYWITFLTSHCSLTILLFYDS